MRGSARACDAVVQRARHAPRKLRGHLESVAVVADVVVVLHRLLRGGPSCTRRGTEWGVPPFSLPPFVFLRAWGFLGAVAAVDAGMPEWVCMQFSRSSER